MSQAAPCYLSPTLKSVAALPDSDELQSVEEAAAMLLLAAYRAQRGRGEYLWLAVMQLHSSKRLHSIASSQVCLALQFWRGDLTRQSCS